MQTAIHFGIIQTDLKHNQSGNIYERVITTNNEKLNYKSESYKRRRRRRRNKLSRKIISDGNHSLEISKRIIQSISSLSRGGLRLD